MNYKGMDREYDENNVSAEVRSSQRTRDAGRDSDNRMTRTNLSVKPKKDMYSNVCGISYEDSENDDMNLQMHSARPRQLGRKKALVDVVCSHRGVSQINTHEIGPRITGLLGTVPREALEQILGYLDPRDLAHLNATCRYFTDSASLSRLLAII